MAWRKASIATAPLPLMMRSAPGAARSQYNGSMRPEPDVHRQRIIESQGLCGDSQRVLGGA